MANLAPMADVLAHYEAAVADGQLAWNQPDAGTQGPYETAVHAVKRRRNEKESLFETRQRMRGNKESLFETGMRMMNENDAFAAEHPQSKATMAEVGQQFLDAMEANEPDEQLPF